MCFATNREILNVTEERQHGGYMLLCLKRV
jgi:hypothetical protein